MRQPLEQTGMDTYLADAPVGCKDDDWRQARLQCPVQVGEALNVQHVHLIYEKHTWYELCHTLVYVLVDHLRGIRDSSNLCCLPAHNTAATTNEHCNALVSVLVNHLQAVPYSSA